MALTFNPQLAAILNTATSKLDWSNKLQTALGNTRRVRCFHDASPSASDPFATGFEFLNVGSTGTLTISSGNITGFGTLSGITIKTAADLTAGASALRIEGGGNWVQGSLGAPGSNSDFTLSGSLTANVGVAFSKSAVIQAPIQLDSGTGPSAPALDNSIVVAARLCDWSTGSRVVVGAMQFSQHEPNVVMELPWQAAEYGDIARIRTPDAGILHWGVGGDSYVLGGDNLISNVLTNGEAAVPLQAVEVRMMPDTGQRWSSYPFDDTFNPAVDTLTPPPHKIELLNGVGAIVDVIEMYSTRDANNTPGSGWPVNDARMSQNVLQDWQGGKRVMPKWTCRMAHEWFSHKPKVHSRAFHFMPGVQPAALDPLNVNSFPADPDQWPIITDNNLMNGLHSYRVSPKWSRADNTGYDTTIIDTSFTQTHDQYWITQLTGHGFEPAANGKRTWYMSPGGSRHDRGAFSHGVVMWASNPTGNRVHGNVPWREMVHHWFMSNFNEAQHYFTDVAKGHGIPKDRLKSGDLAYLGNYYGDAPTLPSNGVRLFTFVASAHFDNGFPRRDKNGNMFANEWQRDYLHSISTTAQAAYLTVSPRHVVNARHSFTSHLLATYFYNTTFFSKDEFMIRGHAWHNWHFANMWCVANNHPDGFSLNEIETMWGTHLEQVYDAVMPEYLAQNTIYGVSIQRFGIHLKEVVDVGTGVRTLIPNADLDSKMYYFGQVIMLMKQTGSYAKMRARSTKCRDILDLWIKSLTTYATGVVLDANGRVDRYGIWQFYPVFPDAATAQHPVNAYIPAPFAGGVANLPATWDGVYPAKGSDDWIHYEDGSMAIGDNPVDGVNTKHYRAQWLWIMRDFFPELMTQRITDSITKIDNWYAQIESARPNVYSAYRFAMMGQIKAPDYVGPPQ